MEAIAVPGKEMRYRIAWPFFRRPRFGLRRKCFNERYAREQTLGHDKIRDNSTARSCRDQVAIP